MKASLHHPGVGTSNRPTEMPSWLNDACKHALTAARQTVHHLCDASRTNDNVKVTTLYPIIKPLVAF